MSLSSCWVAAMEQSEVSKESGMEWNKSSSLFSTFVFKLRQTDIRTKQFISMDCGRVSFCLCGDPDYFSITTRPRLPHSSQSFTINFGLFAAILDENVGIYQFFYNSNKQQARLKTCYHLPLKFGMDILLTSCNWLGAFKYSDALQLKHYIRIWAND